MICDQLGKILGGFFVYFRCVEFDRIGKFEVSSVNSQQSAGIVLGEGSALFARNDIVGDAGDLISLSRIDRESWDGVNFDHRRLLIT